MNEFKIGDWVRRKSDVFHKVDRIDNNYRLQLSTEKFKDFVRDDCEIWEPKEGEWCWFTMSDGSKPLFGQFSGIYKDKFTWDNRYYFSDACEPFIGELPSFIKDNE